MMISEKMKAVVLYGPGDMRIEEISLPAISENDVLVRVVAAGICSSDLSRFIGKSVYRYPLIPGHEIAGEIIFLGSGVKKWVEGQKVAVIPLIPCHHCSYCDRGKYPQCDNYDYLGSRSPGGFAQYVRAPASNLVSLPEGVDFESGALMEPAAVARHAVRLGNPVSGEKVAIYGVGPIGLMVAQWLRMVGVNKIFLVDIQPHKLQLAKELGFSELINSREQDPVAKIRKLSGNQGVDLAFESAGSPVTFEQCLRTVRKLGRVVFLGNVESEVVLSPQVISGILRGELSLIGCWNYDFAAPPLNDWEAVVISLGQGNLQLKPLISHRFSLEEAPQAFRMMVQKTQPYNRVIFSLP